jgi:light-harvesting protein B-800-850 alpha chain
MIYGKLWCVVKPSVGIPLMLGAVAVSSFAVHYMLVTQTTWLKRYLNGGTAVAAAMATPSEAVPTVLAAGPPADSARKQP